MLCINLLGRFHGFPSIYIIKALRTWLTDSVRTRKTQKLLIGSLQYLHTLYKILLGVHRKIFRAIRAFFTPLRKLLCIPFTWWNMIQLPLKWKHPMNNWSPIVTTSLAVMITLKILSTKLLEPDADQFTAVMTQAERSLADNMGHWFYHFVDIY